MTLVLVSAMAVAAEPPTAPAAAASPLQAVDPSAASDPQQAQLGPAASAGEQALFARYTAGTLSADFIELGANGQAFLARHQLAARQPAEVAVLFVPGYARIIASDPLVDAMLGAFAHSAGAVLVPQLPLPAASATRADLEVLAEPALARVQAALAHLHAQGATTVVVVGADDGAGLVARCIADGVERGVAGLVVLGNWDGPLPAPALPILELVDVNEALAMRRATARRMAALTTGRHDYRQIQVADVGRRHPAYADDVAGRIRGWVTRQALPGLMQSAPAVAGRWRTE